MEDMILEAATLSIRDGQNEAFEHAFMRAQAILASRTGYVSHQLHRCLEAPKKYLLLVNWRTLEDHTVGFRESQDFQEWRRLLGHFFEPGTVVEHFEAVALAAAPEAHTPAE